MSIITEVQPVTAGEELLNENLALARDRLCSAMHAPRISEAGYDMLVIDYVEAIQERYFRTANEEVRLRAVNEAPLIIKVEADLLAGYSVATVNDFSERLQTYYRDEHGRFLQKQLYSPIPRAFSMVLFDVINEHTTAQVMK